MEQPSASSRRTLVQSASRAWTSRPDGGLVEEQHLRPAADRDRELRLALLSAGELAVGAIGERVDARAPQRLVDAQRIV